MTSLVKDQQSLVVVSVSPVSVANHKRRGYNFVATYSGDVRGTFRIGQNVKHGGRVITTDYNPVNKTTAVAYFFDNRDSLNAEDSYYRASLASSLLAARVKVKE